MRLAWLWLVPTSLTVAALVMTLGPYSRLRSLAVLFDESPAATLADAAERLARFGQPGAALYCEHLGWDVLFALANGVALAVPPLVFGARMGLGPRLRALLLCVPAAALLADLLENALLFAQFRSTPRPQALVSIAVVTNAKFAAFVAAALLALAVSGAWSVRALLGRGRSQDATT